MSSRDIKAFSDTNGSLIEFWKGAKTVLTITVVDDAGDAENISSWIASGWDIIFRARESLDASANIFSISSPSSSGIAFVTDGTDGQFTVTVEATDTAVAYDSIIVQFLRYDGADYYVPFADGIWTSRIRLGLL